MRIRRYSTPVQIVLGVVLVAVIAGCGGSSSASSGGAPQNAAQTTPQRVALTTPQGAVLSYIKGVQAVNGNAMCNALDESLQKATMRTIVRARPAEAGTPCAQALAGLVAATATPGEAHAKLPRLHVTISGGTAVVTYVGTMSHERHTLALVKRGSGWLIDKINGKG